MHSSSVLSDVLSSFSTLRRRTSTGNSIRSFISRTSSLKRKGSKADRSSTYSSYSVYEQTMPLTILRDPEALRKLLEVILDTPNGKRSVSRLARTCKAVCGPALAVLWRELDNLLPILALFPNDMLKKARRPGLGFVSDRLYDYRHH